MSKKRDKKIEVMKSLLRNNQRNLHIRVLNEIQKKHEVLTNKGVGTGDAVKIIVCYIRDLINEDAISAVEEIIRIAKRRQIKLTKDEYNELKNIAIELYQASIEHLYTSFEADSRYFNITKGTVRSIIDITKTNQLASLKNKITFYVDSEAELSELEGLTTEEKGNRISLVSVVVSIVALGIAGISIYLSIKNTLIT